MKKFRLISTIILAFLTVATTNFSENYDSRYSPPVKPVKRIQRIVKDGDTEYIQTEVVEDDDADYDDDYDNVSEDYESSHEKKEKNVVDKFMKKVENKLKTWFKKKFHKKK